MALAVDDTARREDFTHRLCKLLQAAYGDYFNNLGYNLCLETDFTKGDVEIYLETLIKKLSDEAGLIVGAFIANNIQLLPSHREQLAEIFLDPTSRDATSEILHQHTKAGVTIAPIRNFKDYIRAFLTQAMFDKIKTSDFPHNTLAAWQEATIILITNKAIAAFKDATLKKSPASGYRTHATKFAGYTGTVFLNRPSILPSWFRPTSTYSLNLKGRDLVPPSIAMATSAMPLPVSGSITISTTGEQTPSGAWPQSSASGTGTPAASKATLSLNIAGGDFLARNSCTAGGNNKPANDNPESASGNIARSVPVAPESSCCIWLGHCLGIRGSVRVAPDPGPSAKYNA